MDLVAACRAFVHVSERGSFTVGAAAARMSQPVASRRVAALEERLGDRVFERTSRRATLTPFGRDLLPVARQLVDAADALAHEAEAAKRKPWRLVMPDTCPTPDLARLICEARAHGITLDVRVADPAGRAHLLHAQRVRSAVLAVPVEEAAWSVPLGLATAQDPDAQRIYVETLRATRAASGQPRRIWLQPEDDTPHVRDPLTRLRDAVGLQPAQLVIAGDLTTAAAEVLCSDDALLCSAAQAEELSLHWRPIGELTLTRGFALVSAEGSPQQLRTRLHDAIAACLGVRTPAVTSRALAA